MSLWPADRDAAFPPRCCGVEPEIALDDVCAKFDFVYICQCSQKDAVLLYVLFLCCSTLLFTIIVIITLERWLSGAAEHRSL